MVGEDAGDASSRSIEFRRRCSSICFARSGSRLAVPAHRRRAGNDGRRVARPKATARATPRSSCSSIRSTARAA